MNMTILLALVIACCSILVLKQMVKRAMLRKVGRAALSDAGKRAL